MGKWELWRVLEASCAVGGNVGDEGVNWKSGIKYGARDHAIKGWASGGPVVRCKNSSREGVLWAGAAVKKIIPPGVVRDGSAEKRWHQLSCRVREDRKVRFWGLVLRNQ